MKIALESTNHIIRVNGVPCRVWQGTTEKGVPMQAFIARVSLQEGLDASQFDAELRASPPPIAAFRDVTDIHFVDPDE